MEEFILDRDIKVFYVTAISFPNGIMEAHREIRQSAPPTGERRYFGISRPEPEKNGMIIYKAAAEELYDGEADELKHDTFIIRKGKYISFFIEDYMKDEVSIGKAFQKITSYPDIDPHGYCIEWYSGDNDVMCMVMLKTE